jgi:hypothetical protein
LAGNIRVSYTLTILMFSKNDPRLLAFGVVALLFANVASATGIFQSPIDSFVKSANGGWDVLIFALGYIGWYFILMYAYYLPGTRQLSQLIVPGAAAAIVAYIAGIKPGFPGANPPPGVATNRYNYCLPASGIRRYKSAVELGGTHLVMRAATCA